MTGRHAVALVSDFLTPGWRAECECGWVSASGLTSLRAQQDFEAHRTDAERQLDLRAETEDDER